jgi:hypothetical protein
VFNSRSTPARRLVLRDPIHTMPPRMLEAIAVDVAEPDRSMPKLQRSFGLAISHIPVDDLEQLAHVKLKHWCKRVRGLDVCNMFCKCDKPEHCWYMHRTQENTDAMRTYLINTLSRLRNVFINAVHVSLARASTTNGDSDRCAIITINTILPVHTILQDKISIQKTA